LPRVRQLRALVKFSAQQRRVRDAGVVIRIIRKLRSDAGNARQLVVFDAWRNTLKLRNPDGLQLNEPRGRIARKVANRFGDDTKAIPREAIEQQRREYHAIFGKHAGDANSGAASQRPSLAPTGARKSRRPSALDLRSGPDPWLSRA
jgi:hypothetical protein